MSAGCSFSSRAATRTCLAPSCCRPAARRRTPGWSSWIRAATSTCAATAASGWSPPCLRRAWSPARGRRRTSPSTPRAGLIRARAKLHNGRVREVTVRNVPAFLYREGVPVALSDGGRSTPTSPSAGTFSRWWRRRRPGWRSTPRTRTGSPPAGRRSGTRSTRPAGSPIRSCPTSARSTSWNSAAPRGTRAPTRATSWSSGTDRSTAPPAAPGRAPSWPSCAPRGELPLGKPYVHESILGTLFTGVAAEDTAQGGYPAIVPEITGRAYVTGLAQYLLDPEDPLGGGFLL